MIGILFAWWYSAGLRRFFQIIGQRMILIADFFSIGQLFQTLFNPFRQISNVSLRPDAPIGARFRVFTDKLLSRFIGAFMRTLLIIIGTICLILTFLLGAVCFVLYVLMPFLPILCVVLFFMMGGLK